MKERVEDLGRLREKLDQILKMDVFDSHFLSKHNAEKWFPSELDKWKNDREQLVEYLEDRLDECRRNFQWVQEQLWDCYSIAKGDDDDEL